MRIDKVFRELRETLRSPVVLAIWGFMSVMLALAGPFGSYEAVSLLHRLLFWLALTALCIVLGSAIAILVRRVSGLHGFWRTAPLIAVLVTVVLVPPLGRMADTVGDAVRLLPPSRGEIALFVLCMSLGFCAIRTTLETFPAPGSRPTGPPAAVEAPPQGLPRLAERLPADLRGSVHRVSGRDHYVEIATDKGISNLLLRFSDALAELDGSDGLQVHRSHWVAAEAVAGAVRDGGRVFLRLTCGVLVPVSRTYLAAVEARGWLAQA